MRKRAVVFWGAAVAVATAVLMSRRATGESVPETVRHVDLARYAGRWYELARLPLYWENKCVADVTATYTLRPDGAIDVLNECRKKNGEMTASHGKARVAVKDGSNAKLKVTFFWPFSGDYWILRLDPEYRWALVGTPDRRYLWVLSRTPQMDPQEMERLLGEAKAMGYPTERMVHAKQP